ncbi:MAG: hypothetical protein ACI4BC_05255 [Muribaculaceae bacterium]
MKRKWSTMQKGNKILNALSDENCTLATIHGRSGVLGFEQPKDSYLLFTITQGSLKLICNGVMRDAVAGDIYDVPPISFCKFIDASPVTEIVLLYISSHAFNIVFKENIFPQPSIYIKKTTFGPAIHDNPKYSQKFLDNLEQLKILLSMKQTDKTVGIRLALIKYILLDLYDKTISEEKCKETMVSPQAIELVTAFRHLISSKPIPERNLDFYVRRLGVSRQYLSLAVNLVLGHTATQLIDIYCSRLVCMAIYNNESIERIVTDFRFANAQALNKFLKLNVGFTVSELKKNNK